jgi:DNA-binding NarL/FixJ family response regulator
MTHDKIKVIIADDHKLIRKGYASMIEKDRRISITGEAENGRELIEMLKADLCDIVLLDLEMPVMNGDEALSIILKRFPEVGVIVVSMHYSETLVANFLSRGAGAYLPKNTEPRSLLEAIVSVHSQGQYFSPEISKAMLMELKREKAFTGLFDKLALTRREIEILKLLCEGKTNKEIGERVYITPRTVDFHRRNIYSKTKLSTTAELVLYAATNGIINLNLRASI